MIGFIRPCIRRRFWTSPPETPEWHATYQQAAVFSEMLTALMTNWARHAESALPVDQRPPHFEGLITSDTWQAWTKGFPEDGSDDWRYFLKSVALMDHHIREMLYWMEHYNGTLNGSGLSALKCCD